MVDRDLDRLDVLESDGPGEVGNVGGEDERVFEGKESGRCDELVEGENRDETLLAPALLNAPRSALPQVDRASGDSDGEREKDDTAERPRDVVVPCSLSVRQVNPQAGGLLAVRYADESDVRRRLEVWDLVADPRDVDFRRY